MTTNASEIKKRGMECLIDKLGIVEAEMFITIMLREHFDYTEWQQEHYDAMPEGAFLQNALKYSEKYPFGGKAKRVTVNAD